MGLEAGFGDGARSGVGSQRGSRTIRERAGIFASIYWDEETASEVKTAIVGRKLNSLVTPQQP